MTKSPLKMKPTTKTTFPVPIPFKFLLSINNEQLAAVLTDDSIEIWSSDFYPKQFKPNLSFITSIAQLNNQTLIIGNNICEIQLFNFKSNTTTVLNQFKASTQNSIDSLVGFNLNAKQYIGSASLGLIQIWDRLSSNRL